MAGGMFRKSEKGAVASLQKGEKMVRLGIRALISRITRRQPTHKPPTPLDSNMVYSYSAPFDTGKLKVSDIHSLQSVPSSRFPYPFPLAFLLLTREKTATRFQEIGMVPQVRFVGSPATLRPTSQVVDHSAYHDNECRQSSSSMVRSRATDRSE